MVWRVTIGLLLDDPLLLVGTDVGYYSKIDWLSILGLDVPDKVYRVVCRIETKGSLDK